MILIDSGEYRNAVSPAMHGFLSRDGLDPSELRRIGREQLECCLSLSGGHATSTWFICHGDDQSRLTRTMSSVEAATAIAGRTLGSTSLDCAWLRIDPTSNSARR